MNRATLKKYMVNAYHKKQNAKMRALFAALAAMGRLPGYNDPITRLDLALLLWVNGASGYSSERGIIKFIKGQFKRVLEGIKAGYIPSKVSNPFFALASLLGDSEKLKSLASIAIHQGTGLIMATWADGKNTVISNYSTVDSDTMDEESKILELTIYSGQMIRELTQLIALDELIEKAKPKKSEAEYIKELEAALAE